MRTLLAAVILASGVTAFAGASGSMIITAEAIDTSGSDFEKDAKKKQVQSLPQRNEQWTLYFLAFLKKTAGSSEVQLVFYDTADKGHEPTNAFPIATQPKAKNLVSSVTFSVDQGFKMGHKYNVMVTRLVGGKEDIYARTTITLK
jgi:hypothetical protein